MMSLLICNGSPRGEQSNSMVVSTWIKQEEDEIITLRQKSQYDRFLQWMDQYDKLVFVYPLYVDATPGIVKAFLEYLEEHKDILLNKEVLFIVHSGFGEAVHCRVLERYHQILAELFSFSRTETIITPGSEGIRLMPPNMTAKRRKKIQILVDQFRVGEPLDPKILAQLAGREQMSFFRRVLYRLISLTGLTNYYWNSHLKRNEAYDKRFARPYNINKSE